MPELGIVRGDHVTWTVAIVDEVSLAPADLTDATLWWTIKLNRSQSDDDAVVRAYWVDGGTSSGISVDTPATGIATFEITSAQSLLMKPTSYLYDVQLARDGKIATVDSGTIVVTGDVTTRTTTP